MENDKKVTAPKKIAKPLNKTQLRSGYNECIHNADRLIKDAELLGKHKRYRAAYLMALLAIEELGKAVWLRISQAIEPEKWGWWWNEFRKHPTKLAASMLTWMQVHEWEEYEKNWKAAYKKNDEDGKAIFESRNKAMYVDFDHENEVFVPATQDDEVREDFQKQLEFARWLSVWLVTH
jgi:AbiV family abortive infection protein